MRVEDKLNILGEPFKEFIFDLECGGSFSVCFPNQASTVKGEDYAYGLFTLKQEGEPVTLETYFGIDGDDMGMLSQILIKNMLNANYKQKNDNKQSDNE